MEKLSQIEETIRAYNDFLWNVAAQADRTNDLKNHIEHLNALNSMKDKSYEKHMRSKNEDGIKHWDDPLWWIAAAINYNNITLRRIQEDSFGKHQLKKIEENSLTVNTKPFKHSLVQGWYDYCKVNGIDYNIFEMARINGVDLYA